MRQGVAVGRDESSLGPVGKEDGAADARTVAGDVNACGEARDALFMEFQNLKAANRVLEKKIAERTAELEAAIKEKESFSYSVSHDLRAPLRHIDSFSAILMADHAEHLPSEALDHLNRIRAAAGRMATLIDHLLELSRAGKREMDLQTVDLSDLAASTLRMYQETEPGRGAKVVIEEGLTALGDRTLLGQLLDNLLGNAWKYTSKKKHPRIEFGRKLLYGRQAYFVKDNGAGFDMVYRSKIFRAFERVHGAEYEGAGIGLATVQRIVQRHGGTIWAEGKVGQGAIFYFTLQKMTCGTGY